MTKSIEEQALEYPPFNTTKESFIAGAKSRDAQFLAVVNGLETLYYNNPNVRQDAYNQGVRDCKTRVNQSRSTAERDGDEIMNTDFEKDKVEAVLSISILRENTIVELKERSGELTPVKSPFGGMTGFGWGSVCCLADLKTTELIRLKQYLESLIVKRGEQ